MKFLFKFLKIILILYVIILFEGLCYRFVEKYAEYRLKLAWGQIDQKGEITSVLPLDHFEKNPSNHEGPEGLKVRIREEVNYGKSILSFGRPLLDIFEDFNQIQSDPLQDFTIRNIKNDVCQIDGVIFPFLRRTATSFDVDQKLARREGDILDYANAMLVLLYDIDDLKDAEMREVEKLFSFLLSRGIACAAVPFSDSNNFSAQIDLLKSDYPLIANNLILWGFEKTTTILANLIADHHDLASMLILQNPDKEKVDNYQFASGCWTAVILSNEKVEEYTPSSKRNFLNLLDKSRNSEFSYQKKLGGLLYITEEDDMFFPKSLLTQIVKCMDFHTVTKIGLESDTVTTANNHGENNHTDSLTEASSKYSILEESNYENSFSSKTSLDEESDEDFMCKTVNTYRQLHSEDQSLDQLSNAQIVYELGKAFEQMGDSYMNEVRQDDPIFFKLYNSLKDNSIKSESTP